MKHRLFFCDQCTHHCQLKIRIGHEKPRFCLMYGPNTAFPNVEWKRARTKRDVIDGQKREVD